MVDDQNQHYDLNADNKHLGRLYIFPVEEPSLLAIGITSQWFVTHQEAGVIVSGHVNEAGQWSISAPFSLEPSFEYQNKNELFDHVFQKDFVSSLKQTKEEELVYRPTNLPTLSSDKPDDSSNEEETQLERQPKVLDEVPTTVKIYPSFDFNALVEEKEMKKEEDIIYRDSLDSSIDVEQSRKQIEEMLAFLLVSSQMEEEKAQSSTSLWLLTESQGIKYLIDREDNHVVLAVDETGHILSSLSEGDAIVAAKVIEELDTEEESQEISDDLLPPVNTPHSQSNQNNRNLIELEP